MTNKEFEKRKKETEKEGRCFICKRNDRPRVIRDGYILCEQHPTVKDNQGSYRFKPF